jgi:predicted RNA polymerase sigma factor
LDLVEQLVATREFEAYHLLLSVRGDLLLQLGRVEEARDEFRRAAPVTRNECGRALLLRPGEMLDGVNRC